MLAAIGALAASLVWLVALPILSRRAIRFASARLARQMPMTMAEINAEKDLLRARHALALRELERSATAARTRVAIEMGENGRHVSRIVALETALDAARETIRALETDLGATTRAMHAAEGTLGTQMILLHEALDLGQRRFDHLNATRARLDLIEGVAEERRATIAALETRATGEDLRLRAALARAAALTTDLATTRTTMDERTNERDGSRADAASRAAERDALQARVAEMTAALAEGQTERVALAAAADRTDQRLRLQAGTIEGLSDRVIAQETERDALHRLLDEANARRDALLADRAHRLAGRADTFPADAPPPNEVAPAPPSPPGTSEDRAARLRLAVAALAADLVAFAEAGEGEAPPEGVERG